MYSLFFSRSIKKIVHYEQFSSKFIEKTHSWATQRISFCYRDARFCSKFLFLDHKIRLPQFVLNLMYVWRGIFAVIIIRIFVDMECTEGITLLQQVSKIRVLWRDQIIQAICTAEKSFAGWITTIQCLPSLATKYQILFWITK